MSKLRRLLLNPLVIIAPIACLAGVLYYFYGPSLSAILAPTHNILPNNNFMSQDADGLPTGWQLSAHTPTIKYTTPAGYISPKSLRIENSGIDEKGSVTITSPEAPIKDGRVYHYKSHYRSSVPFDLVAQETYDDGSVSRMIIQRYQATSEWSTASSALFIGPKLRSVRFSYSLSEKGDIQLSDTSLRIDPTDVKPTAIPHLSSHSSSVISLAQSDANSAEEWGTFSAGDNHATFSNHRQATDGPFLRTEISAYKNGEAKWHHKPISLSGGDAAQVGLTYRSNQMTDVVAEYVLKNDKRQFVTLTTLLPAANWTTYRTLLTAPPEATSVVITAVLRGEGVVDTKDYTLNSIPQNGTINWKRPLLSYTFDDGWESAYQNGRKLLDQTGAKATFYLNPSSIDTPEFMTTEQVAELHDRGHELASHGYEHRNLTTLNSSAIDYQFKRADDYFRQVFGMNSVNFAAPFGSVDPQLTFYAQKYYTSARGTQDGINTKQSFDPYNLRVLYMGRDTRIERLKEALAQAQASNGWLILVYHRIDEATTSDTSIAPAQFKSHIDTVHASGIPVATVKSALEEIRQQ
jgi:peptidoglycan/xylan/chitin deacetylase (PgdA/CDA1 family)